jgi:hypothetical protein
LKLHALEEQGEVFEVTMEDKKLKDGKLHEPLLVNVEMLEKTYTQVQESLLHDHVMKNWKIFHSECYMTPGCKCYHYGHIVI